MSFFLRRPPVRAAIICCLMVFQCHLLYQATFHQHPLTESAGGTSPAVSPGSSQSHPAAATELTCPVCQMVRHNLALPVADSPVLHGAASVSRLPLFCPGDYHSCQAIVLFGRAPPFPSLLAGPRFDGLRLSKIHGGKTRRLRKARCPGYPFPKAKSNLPRWCCQGT